MRLKGAAIAVVAVFSLAGTASAQERFTAQRDIVYAPSHGLRMDAYVPAGDGPFPAVVLLHPGGFEGGSRQMMDQVAEALAARGYAAFTLDYRLAPQDPFPAAVEDCRHAVEYLRAHASDLGVDPTRIGALGASAGGNLAAMLGWQGEGSWDRGSRIAAVVSWSGPLDLELTLRRESAFERPLADYTGHVGGEAPPEALRQASPTTYVDGSDPPSLIVNSTVELVRIGVAREADAALEAAGVPHRLLVMPPDLHALDYTDRALAPTVAFLDRFLRDFTPPPPGATPSPSASSSASPSSTSSAEAADTGGPPADGGAGPLWPLWIAAGAFGLLVADALRERRRG